MEKSVKKGAKIEIFVFSNLGQFQDKNHLKRLIRQKIKIQNKSKIFFFFSFPGKIIDLIKREQIRNEMIEEDNAILNENEVIVEVNEMVETNSLEEMEEAVNRVTHVMEYDPVFDPNTVNLRQDDVELDEDEEEEEETSLEDIVVGVYQALPKDVQQGIREGYEYATER